MVCGGRGVCGCLWVGGLGGGAGAGGVGVGVWGEGCVGGFVWVGVQRDSVRASQAAAVAAAAAATAVCVVVAWGGGIELGDKEGRGQHRLEDCGRVNKPTASLNMPHACGWGGGSRGRGESRQHRLEDRTRVASQSPHPQVPPMRHRLACSGCPNTTPLFPATLLNADCVQSSEIWSLAEPPSLPKKGFLEANS